MNPIAKLLVAALLLTGSAVGIAVPAVNPAPAATPTTAAAAADTTTELTEAEAVSAALTHAGLTDTEAARLTAHRERDDGRPVWDVEFRHGDHAYDYTIHAETGEILEWDREYDPPKPVATEPPATEAPETEPSAGEAAVLTGSEALAIALKHAGLSADQVSRIRYEYDVDDGVPEWEIEFRRGGHEYDYTIHAETGRILEWEKDLDD